MKGMWSRSLRPFRQRLQADTAAVSTLGSQLSGKADAAAVAQAVGQMGADIAARALKTEVPKVASSMPAGEAVTPAQGQSMEFDGAGHSHPRPVSSTYAAVVGTGGMTGDINFTRKFSAKPTVTFTVEDPAGISPPTVVIKSWIMGAGADAGLFIGCVAKGYRDRPMPTIEPLSGLTLLTTLLTALNSTVISALSGFKTYIPLEAGTEISVLAVKRSDV